MLSLSKMVERIGDKLIFTHIGLEKAMAKYKPHDYSQRVMIPVSLEEQLVPGTLEFAIQTLVEDRMDMAVFENHYRNDETGRMAYDPKILLKVVLLGYARGLVSSRKMEQACWENVTFMALACGQRPDHSTIAAFVSSMRGEIVGTWELIEGDGKEGGYGEGAGDISSADWDCGADVCEHPGGEGVGLIYVAGKDQGEYPVGVVLYGSQYREDYELWVCLEGLKEDRNIQIG